MDWELDRKYFINCTKEEEIHLAGQTEVKQRDETEVQHYKKSVTRPKGAVTKYTVKKIS